MLTMSHVGSEQHLVGALNHSNHVENPRDPSVWSSFCSSLPRYHHDQQQQHYSSFSSETSLLSHSSSSSSSSEAPFEQAMVNMVSGSTNQCHCFPLGQTFCSCGTAKDESTSYPPPSFLQQRHHSRSVTASDMSSSSHTSIVVDVAGKPPLDAISTTTTNNLETINPEWHSLSTPTTTSSSFSVSPLFPTTQLQQQQHVEENNRNSTNHDSLSGHHSSSNQVRSPAHATSHPNLFGSFMHGWSHDTAPERRYSSAECVFSTAYTAIPTKTATTAEAATGSLVSAAAAAHPHPLSLPSRRVSVPFSWQSAAHSTDPFLRYRSETVTGAYMSNFGSPPGSNANLASLSPTLARDAPPFSHQSNRLVDVSQRSASLQLHLGVDTHSDIYLNAGHARSIEHKPHEMNYDLHNWSFSAYQSQQQHAQPANASQDLTNTHTPATSTADLHHLSASYYSVAGARAKPCDANSTLAMSIKAERTDPWPVTSTTRMSVVAQNLVSSSLAASAASGSSPRRPSYSSNNSHGNSLALGPCLPSSPTMASPSSSCNGELPVFCGRDFATDDARWAAMMARSHAADQFFLYGALTTKIVCKPSCASKRPDRGRVRFFINPGAAEAAIAAGFRPCKRCKPQVPGISDQCVLAVGECVRHITQSAYTGISDDAGLKRRTLKEYAAMAKLSPFHFHRTFKAVSSVTPGEYAKACHTLALQDSLGIDSHGQRNGLDAVTLHHLLQGWSIRRARRAVGGTSPSLYSSGCTDLSLFWTCVSTGFGTVAIAFSEAIEEVPAKLYATILGDDAHVRIQTRFPFAIHRPDQQAWLADLVQHLVNSSDREVQLPFDVHYPVRKARIWIAVFRALLQPTCSSWPFDEQDDEEVDAENETEAVVVDPCVV